MDTVKKKKKKKLYSDEEWVWDDINNLLFLKKQNTKSLRDVTSNQIWIFFSLKNYNLGLKMFVCVCMILLSS